MTPTTFETEIYDGLLKRILESDADDDFSKHFPLSNSIPEVPLPPELEAALEDTAQTEKYLCNLKEAWKAAGLTDAMKRALELLHDNSGLTSGNSGEDDEDSDGSNDEPSTPTTDIQDVQPQPKVAEGSISRLVNGVSSLVDIETCFNKLRISELDLPITPESTIKSVLTELYKLQEDLQIHLQGGPLADPSTLGTQRRKKVADLLERVMKEAALYDEFVNRAQHLSLDRILNESEGSSEDDFIDSETLDTESEIQDSLSDISRRSVTTTSTTPLSPSSLRALEPSLARLRSASSASNPSMQSKASSRLSRSSSPSVMGLEDLGLLAPPEPWEAFRWTPLSKISEHLYSSDTRQSEGLATVLAVSGVIAVGTTRGLILVYDFSLSLKCTLGSTVNALEHGAVTSLAISSDHTQIVSGHAQGHIFIWDLQRPISPVRSILPISSAVAAGGRKEGHIRGSSILHVGFVGVRKNGIVSGDDNGMAFYHNLYKIMLVNATETTRILGRYPALTSISDTTASKQRRPSTVFGLAPLPLGQSPHGSEGFGLVAMLTPYKMIIVSTKPTAQTQYKYLKPKNVSVDSSSKSIAGCLAWYPAAKFQLNNDAPIEHSDPLLAFSWGNHLTILKVTVSLSATSELPPTRRRRSERDIKLEYTKVGDWKSMNSIVGLQWLSPQILLILTNTEDIIVFDPKFLQEFEQSNIRQRSLVYHDRYSSLFKDVTYDPNAQADMSRPTFELAYYHSMRVYKGNVFLLGVRQLYVGTLLSWADRILALVQSGDFLEAIALATSFYNKTSSQTILGLPDDEESRHAIVGEKLMDLLNASINYAFSSERTFQGMVDEHNGSGTVLFHDLAIACIEACLSMHREDFLFSEVYERYSDAFAKGILLEVIGSHILEDKIKDLPPEIMKDLVDHYRNRRMLVKVEKCIWHINPQCIDIDQVVQLCQSEGLYDAMIYVWNRSMVDYVNPAVELLKVIRKILISEKRKKRKHRSTPSRSSRSSISIDANVLEAGEDLETMKTNARKFYTYMKNILTGQTYPNGAPLTEAEANEARTTLYSFVFSGRCVVWPRHGGELILTAEDEIKGPEPTYPYLRIFLRFDAKAFLQALEVAFEDSYLNGVEIIMNGDEYFEEEELPGKIINRQLLVNILLEVMTGSSDNSEFSQKDISYLYSFVARNLPKYPQFLLLSPSVIHKMLVELSTDNDPQTREERQLSVECLLSIYTPSDENQMVQRYENAGFWRVLEHVYKADKKYDLLVTTYLKDPERRKEVFDCIRSLLNTKSKLTEEQREKVTQKIIEKIKDIVDIDGEQTAAIIKAYFNSDHRTVISNLITSPARLFTYLRGLLEPSQENITGGELIRVRNVEEQVIMSEAQSESLHIDPEIHEQYIALMCQFDPTGVYHYLQTHQETYRIEYVLPICEATGIVDAVVWILEKSGNAMGALDKVLDIIQEKTEEILALIDEKKNDTNDRWTLLEKTKIETSLMKLKGVLKIGILLCENSCRRATLAKGSTGVVSVPQMNRATESETELLWYKLLDAFLNATKAVSSSVIPPIPPMMSERLLANGQISSFEVPKSPIPPHIANHLITTFKSYVQSIMRSLLLSTSSPYVSLPRLLLRFMSEAKKNSTVSDFRDIFVGMIDTYKYEGQLLAMTNRLFEKDLFMGVAGVVRQRGKGWRPRRGACEVCGGQFWGTELNNPLTLRAPSGWGSPEKKTPHSSTISNPANSADALPTLELLEGTDQSDEASTSIKPLPPLPPSPHSLPTSSTIQENDLLLFRCGHGYHRRCLETESNYSTESEPESCTVCQTERRREPLVEQRNWVESSTGKNKGKDKVVNLMLSYKLQIP
ncbi:141_t:CDS:10 [Funneliformis mosseae]|uniref:141_t:CDS:1 n=1 Tax=Funneliformis mosseae TaxID=27381 RepID=A0A9N8VBK1_FUNMO|nr:141_t:CDS:10 [Funneliformis mosseae]